MVWRLVLFDDRIREIALRPGEWIVGRSRHASVVVRDEILSRRHLALRVDPERVVLEDLESGHGCFVNGSRVSNYDLDPGDLVEAGSTVLAVVAADTWLDEARLPRVRNGTKARELVRYVNGRPETEARRFVDALLEDAPESSDGDAFDDAPDPVVRERVQEQFTREQAVAAELVAELGKERPSVSARRLFERLLRDELARRLLASSADLRRLVSATAEERLESGALDTGALLDALLRAPGRDLASSAEAANARTSKLVFRPRLPPDGLPPDGLPPDGLPPDGLPPDDEPDGLREEPADPAGPSPD